jgi:hypothetical protein
VPEGQKAREIKSREIFIRDRPAEDHIRTGNGAELVAGVRIFARPLATTADSFPRDADVESMTAPSGNSTVAASRPLRSELNDKASGIGDATETRSTPEGTEPQIEDADWPILRRISCDFATRAPSSL